MAARAATLFHFLLGQKLVTTFDSIRYTHSAHINVLDGPHAKRGQGTFFRGWTPLESTLPALRSGGGRCPHCLPYLGAASLYSALAISGSPRPTRPNCCCAKLGELDFAVAQFFVLRRKTLNTNTNIDQ